MVGIDVAKTSLAITILTAAGKGRHKRCPNTAAGHAELLLWLRRQADGPMHVGLEATGGYQDAVALTLHEAGHTVSVPNPAAVEADGRSQLRRAKTDPTDAALIADTAAHVMDRVLARPANGLLRSELSLSGYRLPVSFFPHTRGGRTTDGMKLKWPEGKRSTNPVLD